MPTFSQQTSQRCVARTSWLKQTDASYGNQTDRIQWRYLSCWRYFILCQHNRASLWVSTSVESLAGQRRFSHPQMVLQFREVHPVHTNRGSWTASTTQRVRFQQSYQGTVSSWSLPHEAFSNHRVSKQQSESSILRWKSSSTLSAYSLLLLSSPNYNSCAAHLLVWINFKSFVRNPVVIIPPESSEYQRIEQYRSATNSADIVSCGQIRSNWEKTSDGTAQGSWHHISWVQHRGHRKNPEDEVPELKSIIATPAVRCESFQFVQHFSSIQCIMSYVFVSSNIAENHDQPIVDMETI